MSQAESTQSTHNSTSQESGLFSSGGETPFQTEESSPVDQLPEVPASVQQLLKTIFEPTESVPAAESLQSKKKQNLKSGRGKTRNLKGRREGARISAISNAKGIQVRELRRSRRKGESKGDEGIITDVGGAVEAGPAICSVCNKSIIAGKCACG